MITKVIPMIRGFLLYRYIYIYIYIYLINVCLYYSGLRAAYSAFPSVITVNDYTKLLQHTLPSTCLKQVCNRHPTLPQPPPSPT